MTPPAVAPSRARRWWARHPVWTVWIVLAVVGGLFRLAAGTGEANPYDRYAVAARAAGQAPRPPAFVDSVAPSVCAADPVRLEQVLIVAAGQYDPAVLAGNVWHMALVAAHYCPKPYEAYVAVVQAVGDTMGRATVLTLPTT